ncbi:MAG: CoA transferase [Gammaproteobacteria bacterium]|nr:CoA transferase [Gammaproteobacteria bacterium]
MSRGTQAGALDGIRVLDLSALIAGPSCARYLADHGADVIKLERYPDGDVSRLAFSTDGSGRGPMFLQHNAGKRSICVDLKRGEGLDIVLDLVERCDVVIEAFTPGVMKRLGLGYEALRSRNPAIILCSISGFGQSGPNTDRPGYAHIAHGMTGWLALQFLHRDPPETPRGPGIAIGDTTAGLTAFGAICAALFRRERTGQGEHIDIALFDALFGSNDLSLQAALREPQPEIWYHPVHRTRDGYLTANVGPDHRGWANLCRAMSQAQLAEDPRFCDTGRLQANMDEAVSIVRAWLSTLDSETAEQVLMRHHVACGRVYTVDQAVRQPQVLERGLVVDVEDPVLGPIKVINSAFCYAEASSGVRGPAPHLGQHNAEVLAGVLGYDEARIDALRISGVLKSSAT